MNKMNETERLLKCLPFTAEGVPGDSYPLVITKLYDSRYMIGYWKYGQRVDWSKATYLISFSDKNINKALRGLLKWVKERMEINKSST
jgi:hypothetical protein